jgi:hypothetical protein
MSDFERLTLPVLCLMNNKISLLFLKNPALVISELALRPGDQLSSNKNNKFTALNFIFSQL